MKKVQSLKEQIHEKYGNEWLKKLEDKDGDVVSDKIKKWKEKRNQRGVIFISGLPFGCTAFQLRKIFTEFGKVTNVQLEAAKDSQGKPKKIFRRWIEYAEAWVEFEDKKMAKLVARILNGSKVPQKYLNNRMAKGHVWDMKYLKGFKWHHLLEHREQTRIFEHKKFEKAVSEAHRQASYFKDQFKRAQEMKGTLDTGNRKRRREELKTMTELVKNRDLETFMPSDDEITSAQNEKNLVYESSDDELPPLKRQKLVDQKTVQHRNTGFKRRVNTLGKSLWK